MKRLIMFAVLAFGQRPRRGLHDDRTVVWGVQTPRQPKNMLG
ncbi:MAG: hypothetical protein WCA59_20205 [Candidatus Binataceae bacterium]